VTDLPAGTTADWLLALIPVTLLGGLAVGWLSSLSLALGAVAGSVPASGLVGYALFFAGIGEK
jgi:hypothetical protein